MIVIVTDSSACMTREEARELGVVCVPMTYTVGDKIYTEQFIGENGDYEKLIASSGELRTAQASIDSFISTFKMLLRTNMDVLCLTISSRLSGTYNNASICAREMDAQRIRVVDTATTAGGMLFMIEQARKLIDSGLGLAEVVKALETQRGSIKTLFSVKDMGPLRRSGRLGSVRQAVGTMLNIRPLLTCNIDGAVESIGSVRGRTEQLSSLINAVPADAEGIIVHYISLEEDAQYIAAKLGEKCSAPVQLREIGPVLGIHLGLDILSTMWKVRLD